MTGDRLARIEETPPLYANGIETPWVLLDMKDARALVEIAKAARVQAEREPGALDTAIRSALARLDSEGAK